MLPAGVACCDTYFYAWSSWRLRSTLSVSPKSMPEAGDILDGRYQLVRDLGRGAAGVVFEARHLFTGRFVAVKMVVPGPRSAGITELRARLQREGRALASVRHPGVVEVLDGGVTLDGVSYVVMEMLEGRTLEGLLAARTKLPVHTTVAVALQLCDALAAVHEAGIVHRDIKPSNIILLRDKDGRERVKLVDFGIAKMEQTDGDKLTGVGAVIGTPAYMSPEQLLALDDVDLTSDVYAVGVTMFECLTGTMPYTGGYPQVLLGVTASQPPPSVRSVAPEVPLALVLVVDRAIAKSRTSRFASVQELAGALEAAVPDARRETTLLGPPPLPRQESPAEAQRRRARRAPYNTPVQLVLHGSQSRTIDGRTEDISEGGILVLSHAECAADQRVAVRFALPMEGKVVSVDAQVRWIRAAPGPHAPGICAMGLEFVDLQSAVRSSIAQYVGLMADRNQA
jgi:serine/threonine-protein kinase